MATKLSPTQVAVIALMQSGDGTIARYRGGFWAQPGLDPKHIEHHKRCERDDVCTTQTLQALEKKGLVEISQTAPETRYNRGGWAIEYKLTQAGVEQ